MKRGWFYYWPPKTLEGPRPKAVALKTKEFGVALEEVERRRGDGAVEAAVMRGSMRELLPVYLAEGAGDSEATRRSREKILTSFMEIAGNPKVEKINEGVIMGWRTHLLTHGGRPVGMRKDKKKERPVTPATVKTYLIALRAFLNWARERGAIRWTDQTYPLRKFKRDLNMKSSKVEAFHTIEEREALLGAGAEEEIQFILMFGLLQGFRLQDMLAMKKEWLWIAEDWSRGTVTVQSTRIERRDKSVFVWEPKSRVERVVPLHPRVLVFLKDYGLREPFMLKPENAWPEEGKTSYRYDPCRRLSSVAAAAGVGRTNYHKLRHSFGTHLAEKRVPMKEIAALLGDTLRCTEEHYIGFSPSYGQSLAML